MLKFISSIQLDWNTINLFGCVCVYAEEAETTEIVSLILINLIAIYAYYKRIESIEWRFRLVRLVLFLSKT